MEWVEAVPEAAESAKQFNLAIKSPYAPLASSPYAALAPPSYYPSPYGSRYEAARPGRKLIRRITVIIPPPRTEGRLLWIAADEFEQSFEYRGNDEDVWHSVASSTSMTPP